MTCFPPEVYKDRDDPRGVRPEVGHPGPSTAGYRGPGRMAVPRFQSWRWLDS